MTSPEIRRRVRTALLFGLSIAIAAIAQLASAQITELPFDLVDMADNPGDSEFCGIDFTYISDDTFSAQQAGGVSIADFDNDGLIDVFLPNSKTRPNKLYRNLGAGQFQDVAVARGVDDPAPSGGAAVFFDYDHDGDLDLFVLNHLGYPALPLGPHFRLFRNQGAAGGFAFSNVTPTAGFAFAATSKQSLWGWVSGVAVGDYDQDGWSDLFISWNGSVQSQDQWRLFHNVVNPTPGDPGTPTYTPRIFVDVTKNSGLEGEYGGNPWQVQFWDVNRDGWPDIHIAQDMTLDLMFINNKNGTFTNVATAVGLNGDPPEFRAEMGSALGDPDNDLDLDMHSTNIGDEDRFYRNDSIKTALSFTDVGVVTGLNTSVFGWGTLWVDLDNDGDQDHAAVSGYAHNPNLLYKNAVHLNLFPAKLPDGINVAWADVTSLVPDYSKVNTQFGDIARGLSAGDYDLDGDMDLFVTRNAGRAAVYKNTLQSDNGWLEVDLVNSSGSLDTAGASVYVNQGGKTQLRQVILGSSYLCQEPQRLHFGLGKPAAPKTARGKGQLDGSIFKPSGTYSGTPGTTLPTGGTPPIAVELNPRWMVVNWPDGPYQILLQPARNTIHTLVRSAVNDAGDMNADGHLTTVDQAMLLLATQDQVAFAAAYPMSPGLIVGDINRDGVLDADDYTAWSSLPPH